MISWPCVMKLKGDDELLYFNLENDLLSECQSLILNTNDVLIDSSGRSYKLNRTKDNGINFVRSTRCYTAEDLSYLIQAHEFSKANTCLTKIYFSSVSEAISSLSLR